MKSVGVLGTLAGGLIVGQAGADIASGKDPTSNASQGLSGMTEAGLVGLNIDPEYKWSDDNPPEVGFDWLAYKTTQPIKNALLDFTPMGRDRQRQDRQIDVCLRNRADAPKSASKLSGRCPPRSR